MTEEDKGTDRIIDAMNSLLDKKGGDSDEVIKMLLKENYSLRDDKRTLKSEITEIRTKVPGENHIVLTPEDATLFNSWKELGDPKEIKEKLQKGETLQGEIEKRDRSALIAKAAKVAGYNPNVLTDLAESKGFVVEFKEVEVDGQKVDQPFVKVGDKSHELSIFTESNLKDYMPALTNVDDKPPISGKPTPPQFPSRRPAKDEEGKDVKAAVSKIAGQYRTPGQRSAKKE